MCAMPSSGSLGICTCPQGSCSSISTAVGIGSGSLVANADYVGRARCMTAFYGYAPTWYCVDFTNIHNVYCGTSPDCMYIEGSIASWNGSYSPNWSAGQCYSLQLLNQISFNYYEDPNSWSRIQIFCNSSPIESCLYGRMSGTYFQFCTNICVCYDDYVDVYLEACAICCLGACGDTSFNIINGTVGCFCIGSNCNSICAYAPPH